MTTPQNPGDGDTPQDPSDPQNPYGTPPPPPPSSPPPSSPPPRPPPPANPMPPPYGDPNVTSAPPAQPAYAQPTYPQYGAPAGAGEPGKGMAIGALIASILGCTCIGVLVAVPLAIVVLVRSRNGQNYGKGLAIAALVISLLSVIGLGLGGFAVYNYAKDFKTVGDLAQGDCITAKGLTDASATGVTEIKSVGCSAKHDGEVRAVHTLSGDEANSFGQSSPLDICTPPVTEAGSAALLTNPELAIIALTEDATPSSGDTLACVIANADGSKLTSKLGS
jgi:hypothetical protein